MKRKLHFSKSKDEIYTNQGILYAKRSGKDHYHRVESYPENHYLDEECREEEVCVAWDYNGNCRERVTVTICTPRNF